MSESIFHTIAKETADELAKIVLALATQQEYLHTAKEDIAILKKQIAALEEKIGPWQPNTATNAIGPLGIPTQTSSMWRRELPTVPGDYWFRNVVTGGEARIVEVKMAVTGLRWTDRDGNFGNLIPSLSAGWWWQGPLKPND